jgi:hypothetical protein
MEAAMTWAAATDAEETAREPLSPELVLVSPDLRERALRELTFPHERNRARPPQLRVLELARDHPEDPEEEQASLLRAAGAAVLNFTAVAVLLVLIVAGTAVGLTVVGGQAEPELASRPAAVPPASQGIGSAVVDDAAVVEPQPGRAPDRWRRSPGPVWNLDALVRDAFGSRPLRLIERTSAPRLRALAVPLMLRESYISCGEKRWVAAEDGALSCVRER